MHRFTRKRLALMATIATLPGIALVFVSIGAGNAAVTPELSPSEAANIAVHQVRLAEIASCVETCTLNALEVSTAHASHFGEAQAVIARKPPTSTNFTPSSAAMREWQQSAAYLVVMKSTQPLTLNVPHPPKEKIPSGVVSIVVDSHTGFVEGRAISPVAPDIASLGDVMSSTVPGETRQ